MPKRLRVQGDLYHGIVPEGAVYIGRSAPGLPRSPFHNPFKLNTPGCESVADVLVVYENWLAYGHTAPYPRPGESARLAAIREEALTRIEAGELTGRDVACWCREGSPCHGDILLRAVEEITGGVHRTVEEFLGGDR
jgi:hypothetical protein